MNTLDIQEYAVSFQVSEQVTECEWVSAKVHLLKKQGEIVWEGNSINGATLVIETRTPKTKRGNFGKASTIFYIQEANSPTFETIEAFTAHYADK